ncbi:MAG: hypothetical protein PARBA_00466 [Parabacteroides sp.]
MKQIEQILTLLHECPTECILLILMYILSQLIKKMKFKFIINIDFRFMKDEKTHYKYQKINYKCEVHLEILFFIQ